MSRGGQKKQLGEMKAAANALRRLESLPEGAHEILFVKHRGQWIFVVKESHHKTEHLGTS